MFKKFFRDNKIHKKIVPSLDMVFVFRPVDMFVVWVFICVGMYLSTFYPSSFFQEINMSIIDFHASTILMFIGITVLFGCINMKSEDNTSIDLSNKVKNFLLIVSLALLTASDWKFFIIACIIYAVSFYKPNLFRKQKKSYFLNVLKCFLLIIIGLIHTLSSNALHFIISFDFFLLALPYLLSYFSVNFLYDSFDLNNEKNTSIISTKHRKKILLSTILIAFSLFLASGAGLDSF